MSLTQTRAASLANVACLQYDANWANLPQEKQAELIQTWRPLFHHWCNHLNEDLTECFKDLGLNNKPTGEEIYSQPWTLIRHLKPSRILIASIKLGGQTSVSRKREPQEKWLFIHPRSLRLTRLATHQCTCNRNQLPTWYESWMTLQLINSRARSTTTISYIPRRVNQNDNYYQNYPLRQRSMKGRWPYQRLRWIGAGLKQFALPYQK